MPRARISFRPRRETGRCPSAAWHGSPVASRARCDGGAVGGCWLRLTVGIDRVVIACHAAHAVGPEAALALTERVAAFLRGHDPRRFGSPSVELDGRDPAGITAVLRMPIWHAAGVPLSPPGPPPSVAGEAARAKAPPT